MREIKFRAWDEETKQMLEVRDISFNARNNISEVRLWSEDGDSTFYIRNGRVALLQFTGLTDKNGKEIYEGDILGYKEKGEMRIIGEVEFTTGGYWAVKDSTFLWAIRKDREVIGNIWENPELLKIKNNNNE